MRLKTILVTHLDRLIRPTRNQPRPCLVKCRAEHARLGLQRTRLRDILQILEWHSRPVIPKREGTIVTSAEEHSLCVHTERVDNRVVPTKVEHKGALGALPLLDVVAPSGTCGEGVLGGVNSERANALFVVRERCHRLAGGEIPEAHGRVHAACDDLRVGILAFDIRDRRGVP